MSRSRRKHVYGGGECGAINFHGSEKVFRRWLNRIFRHTSRQRLNKEEEPPTNLRRFHWAAFLLSKKGRKYHYEAEEIKEWPRLRWK